MFAQNQNFSGSDEEIFGQSQKFFEQNKLFCAPNKNTNCRKTFKILGKRLFFEIILCLGQKSRNQIQSDKLFFGLHREFGKKPSLTCIFVKYLKVMIRGNVNKIWAKLYCTLNFFRLVRLWYPHSILNRF